MLLVASICCRSESRIDYLLNVFDAVEHHIRRLDWWKNISKLSHPPASVHLLPCDPHFQTVFVLLNAHIRFHPLPIPPSLVGGAPNISKLKVSSASCSEQRRVRSDVVTVNTWPNFSRLFFSPLESCRRRHLWVADCAR